ncbi:MAG: HlyD family efflux transporter periplasmic adaptor subunit [Bacteroidota bacterium]
MDREIDSSILGKERRRQWGKWVAIALLLLIGIWALRQWLRPTAKASDFRIATVEQGPLESTVTAAGLVTPSFEQQVNAPIATEIEKIHLRTGTQVQADELILSLRKTFLELDVNARKSRLAVRENSVELLQLELQRDLQELEYDDEIKGLEVAAAEAQLVDTKRLLTIGSSTAEEVEQAETRLRILRLEKGKLENELTYRRQSLTGRQREVELEANIERQEVRELERKLQLTEVRAPGPGVITWINENIGEQVPEGNPLVRIADLRSFQLEASCSDRYSDRINVGQTVRVRLNDETLDGQISRILPAVANNTVEFLVQLAQPDHPQLRPNMRLEVFVVTARRENVLRVQQGAAFKGGQRQYVFKVVGQEARRLEARIGISNGSFIELQHPDLKAGDRIIISDTEDYDALTTIQLKD